MGNMANKTMTKRHRLHGPCFDGMKRFLWWNEWLHNLEKEKEEHIPGWDGRNHQKCAKYLEDWCAAHGGRRPKRRSEDPVEEKLANWIRMTMAKEKNRHRLHEPCFDGMKRFPWWNEWLDNMEKEKEEK